MTLFDSRKPVQKLYIGQNDKDVLSTILAQKQAGVTLRKIAQGYGALITYGDVARILQGTFPKRKAKRIALGLAPSAKIVVIGKGAVPDGSQAIKAFQCKCGQWFIPNCPARTHCFLCRPVRHR